MSVKIKIIDSISEIDIEEYELLRKQSSGSIFYDYRFLQAAELSPLLPVLKTFYLAAYEDNILVGFLSLYRQNNPDPFGVLDKTTTIEFFADEEALFGHIMHCYESMILAKDQCPNVFKILLDHLKILAKQENISHYGLLNVIDKKLLSLAESEDYLVNYMWDRFFIDFSNFNSFEEFLMQLSRKGRQIYRNQIRKYENSGAYTVFEKIPFTNLEEVVDLCYQTTSKYGTGNYYPKKSFFNFLNLCGELINLISIYHNNKRVGVMITFVEKTPHHEKTMKRSTLHLWACGMNYDYGFSPYIICFAEAFKYALKNKIDLIEAGRTNKYIKEKIGFCALPLYSMIKSESKNESI